MRASPVHWSGGSREVLCPRAHGQSDDRAHSAGVGASAVFCRLLTLSTASDPWTGGRERVVGLGLLVFSDQTFEMYVSGVSDLVVVRLEGRRPLLISPDDIQLFAEVVEPRIIRHVAGTERDSGG